MPLQHNDTDHVTNADTTTWKETVQHSDTDATNATAETISQQDTQLEATETTEGSTMMTGKGIECDMRTGRADTIREKTDTAADHQADLVAEADTPEGHNTKSEGAPHHTI